VELEAGMSELDATGVVLVLVDEAAGVVVVAFFLRACYIYRVRIGTAIIKLANTPSENWRLHL
jgi:lipid-binding SYLF domain-containing protein